MIAFVCHPYHRGGVTQWMKDAFFAFRDESTKTAFITVNPTNTIFGGDRSTMVDFVSEGAPVADLYYKNCNYIFELGTIEYRASVYRNLILKHIPKGGILIPADDEACWMACCSLSKNYKVIGVIHSPAEEYYSFYKQFNKYLSGCVSVSNRIHGIIDSFNLNNNITFATIPCGIHTQKFYSKKKVLNKVVWLGRVAEKLKRAADVIQIAKRFKALEIDIVFHVIGTGSGYPEFVEQISKEELGDYVTMHGWRNTKEIAETLSDTNILLQTSSVEGMSIAVMEALASGCKVVSTRVSGVEDLVTDTLAKDVVFLYEFGDLDTATTILTEQIRTQLNPVIAQGLAKKHYDIYTCKDRYNDVVKQMSIRTDEYEIQSGFIKSIKSKVLATLRYCKLMVITRK